MGTVEEITKLEEHLRLAELGPDPQFFEDHLADEVLLDGQKLKSKVVEAHRPGSQTKFTKVTMSNVEIVDHGNAAIVKCTGTYEGPKWSGTLKFLRVWLKKDNRWQIIAGTTTQ